MAFESWPHLLKPIVAVVGEVDLAQLRQQLPSGNFSSTIGPAEIGDTLGMSYSKKGTKGLEPAAGELVFMVAANSAGYAEDDQQVTNPHDCNFVR